MPSIRHGLHKGIVRRFKLLQTVFFIDKINEPLNIEFLSHKIYISIGPFTRFNHARTHTKFIYILL